MMNRWLGIVLALVIALQSLLAIGDANQPHHPTAAHYILEHTHAHEGADAVPDSPEISGPSTPSQSSPHSSVDHSSHCHQNHAHFHMVLVNPATEIAAFATPQRRAGYRTHHTSATPAPLFRPPIA